MSGNPPPQRPPPGSTGPPPPGSAPPPVQRQGGPPPMDPPGMGRGTHLHQQFGRGSGPLPPGPPQARSLPPGPSGPPFAPMGMGPMLRAPHPSGFRVGAVPPPGGAPPPGAAPPPVGAPGTSRSAGGPPPPGAAPPSTGRPTGGPPPTSAPLPSSRLSTGSASSVTGASRPPSTASSTSSKSSSLPPVGLGRAQSRGDARAKDVRMPAKYLPDDPNFLASLETISIPSDSKDNGGAQPLRGVGFVRGGPNPNGNGNGHGNGNGNGNGNGHGHGGASAATSSSITLPVVPQSPGPLGRGSSRGDRSGIAFFKTRPSELISKKGQSGTIQKLRSNYFELTTKPDWIVYQYRVDFQPEEDFIGLRKKLFRQLPQSQQGVFEGTLYYSPVRHTADMQTPITVATQKDDGSIVHVIIRMVGELHESTLGYVQLQNIIARTCMGKLNLTKVGRDYFNSADSKLLPQHKLEVWPGILTSIRQHEGKMLLCTEVSSKVIRTDNVLDKMKDELKRGVSQDGILKSLIGKVVMTKYNNKTYTISDVEWNKSASSTFPRRDGSQQTFLDYYYQRYNVRVTDPKQVLLVAEPRDKDFRRMKTTPEEAEKDKQILLVPELCNFTGLTEQMKADFRLMKDLGEYTRLPPASRIKALMDFSNRFKTNPDVAQELNKWQLGFSGQMVQVEGRLLNPEKILLGSNRTGEYKAENADWTRYLAKSPMFASANLSKWAVVYPAKEKREVMNFLGELNQVSNGPMNFRLSAPMQVELPDTRTSTYNTKLNELMPKKPDMVMVVIPNKTSDAYGAVKKITYVQNPMPCQVITSQLLRKDKGMSAIAMKVAVQMATKLGAEPWGVNIPIQDTMVVGIDTYHDTLNKNRSIGAIVFTINRNMTRYKSVTAIHEKKEELHSQMLTAFGDALRTYEKENGVPPKRIIVYRDGVGDGQIEEVRETEVQILKQAFGARMGNAPEDFKLAYVIVSKRINTRFFSESKDNPHSGTIVDDVVTLPERYDFFLISQSVRQGTVNPTSYNVVYDSSGLRPDHMQQLTYKLCHLYYNWPGTVRVPSVCQYAHKLAFLVGESVHSKPHKELEELLFYL